MKQENRTLFVCGFSGAGKSTLLRRLSALADSEVNFIDTDELLFRKNAQNESHLGAVIERLGWEEFRRQERSLIEGLISDYSRLTFVALGGGALSSNPDLFFRDGKNSNLIWLYENFDTCWERIKEDPSRPLVKKGKKALIALYHEREKDFSRAQFRLCWDDLQEISTLEGFFGKLSENELDEERENSHN